MSDEPLDKDDEVIAEEDSAFAAALGFGRSNDEGAPDDAPDEATAAMNDEDDRDEGAASGASDDSGADEPVALEDERGDDGPEEVPDERLGADHRHDASQSSERESAPGLARSELERRAAMLGNRKLVMPAEGNSWDTVKSQSARIVDLTEQLHRSRSALASAEEAAREADRLAAGHDREHEAHRDTVADLQKTIASLEAHAEEAEVERTRLQEELAEQSRLLTGAQHLITQLESLRDRAHYPETQPERDLTIELTGLRRALEDSTREATEKEAERADLRAELSVARAAVEAAEIRTQRAERRVAELEDALALRTQELEQLSEAQRDLQTAHHRLGLERAELRSSVAAHQETIEARERELAAQVEQLLITRQGVSERDTQIQLLAGRVESLNESLALKDAELEIRIEELRKSRARATAREGHITSLAETLATIEQAIAGKTPNASALRMIPEARREPDDALPPPRPRPAMAFGSRDGHFVTGPLDEAAPDTKESTPGPAPSESVLESGTPLPIPGRDDEATALVRSEPEAEDAAGSSSRSAFVVASEDLEGDATDDDEPTSGRSGSAVSDDDLEANDDDEEAPPTSKGGGFAVAAEDLEAAQETEPAPKSRGFAVAAEDLEPAEAQSTGSPPVSTGDRGSAAPHEDLHAESDAGQRNDAPSAEAVLAALDQADVGAPDPSNVERSAQDPPELRVVAYDTPHWFMTHRPLAVAAARRYWRDACLSELMNEHRCSGLDDLFAQHCAKRADECGDEPLQIWSVGGGDPALEVRLLSTLAELGIDDAVVHCLEGDAKRCAAREAAAEDAGVADRIQHEPPEWIGWPFEEPCHVLILSDCLAGTDSVTKLLDISREVCQSSGATLLVAERCGPRSLKLGTEAEAALAEVWDVMPDRYRVNLITGEHEDALDPEALAPEMPGDESLEELLPALLDRFNPEVLVCFGHLMDAFLGPARAGHFDIRHEADVEFIDRLTGIDRGRLVADGACARHLVAILRTGDVMEPLLLGPEASA